MEKRLINFKCPMTTHFPLYLYVETTRIVATCMCAAELEHEPIACTVHAQICIINKTPVQMNHYLPPRGTIKRRNKGCAG